MVSAQYESLEVEEDIRFERRAWKFQRAGRIGLLVFLVLAFLGFTGSGPLSNASATSSDNNLTVAYERIDRINSPSTFQFNVSPDLVSEGELQIWIDSDYLNLVKIDQISPEPDSVEVDSDRYVYTFKVSTELEPAPVSFQFLPEKPGILRAHVGVVDGPEISLRKLVLP